MTVLVREFRSRGAYVIEVPAYQSRCPLETPAEIITAFQQQRVDVVTFASSKTVRHFAKLLQQSLDEINPGQSEAAHSVSELLDAICLASIGPQTSKSCVDVLGRVSLEAKEYTLEGLTQALLQYFESSPS